MREIKFRAWVGKMEYDVIVGRFGSFYVNPGVKGDGLDEKDSACLTPFNTKYPDTTPIMQFTGLHDKNGEEIWEGDVISLTANAYRDLDLTMKLAAKGHHAEVIYSEGCFIWYVGNFFYPLNQLIPKTVDQEVKFMFLDALNCDHKGLTCEVLGNIYEHQHLLNREEKP